MYMFNDNQRRLAAAIGSLVYENPFLPARIAAERAILGDQFVAETSVWSHDIRHQLRPNLSAIAARAEALAKHARERLPRAAKSDLRLYEDLVTYVLYDRYSEKLADLALRDSNERVAFYDEFAAEARDF